jgi:acetyl esterase/lipase
MLHRKELVLLASIVVGSCSLAACSRRNRDAQPSTPDDPPFLILQGDKDTIVPMQQSQILYDKLRADGVDATLVIVKNAGHLFAPAAARSVLRVLN